MIFTSSCNLKPFIVIKLSAIEDARDGVQTPRAVQIWDNSSNQIKRARLHCCT